MVKCKRCGGVIELYEGVPLDIEKIDPLSRDLPKYNFCYKCRVKWSKKNLICKQCGCQIDMHNKLFHDGLCDNCFG